MLPKDMLLERTIRKEVCPSIGLPLLTRILCNFMAYEFCPDPVPGVVLEVINSEALSTPRQSNDQHQNNNFPHSASPVKYSPPASPIWPRRWLKSARSHLTLSGQHHWCRERATQATKIWTILMILSLP